MRYRRSRPSPFSRPVLPRFGYPSLNRRKRRGASGLSRPGERLEPGSQLVVDLVAGVLEHLLGDRATCLHEARAYPVRPYAADRTRTRPRRSYSHSRGRVRSRGAPSSLSAGGRLLCQRRATPALRGVRGPGAGVPRSLRARAQDRDAPGRAARPHLGRRRPRALHDPRPSHVQGREPRHADEPREARSLS